MATKRYRVLRAHDGDRWYDVGDTREAVEAEVAHLVPLTLQPVGNAAIKQEPAPANKKAAPLANKAG